MTTIDFKIYAVLIVSEAADTCGQTDITGMSGTLSSPNYPDDYPHNLLCEWTITIPDGQHIRVNITDFFIQKTSSCSADSLEVSIERNKHTTCNVWVNLNVLLITNQLPLMVGAHGLP